MNLYYLIPRLIRHFLPNNIVRFLLRHNLVIKPGLETMAPFQAADRYIEAFAKEGFSIKDKSILLFGYGGNFAVACALLKNGAAHITLCEKETLPDDRRNLALLKDFSAYLNYDDGYVTPNKDVITLAIGDISEILKGSRFDAVLSTSVFEHLSDVEGITLALTRMTAPNGLHLHYIDLRDHYFKYPFEMLCYTKDTWYSWLNPTSHHNRWRLLQYQALFEELFSTVKIDILERDYTNFDKVKFRIQPEFLSGDVETDAVTLIKVLAKNPRSS